MDTPSRHQQRNTNRPRPCHPAPGKSYYAWLVVNNYQTEAGSLLLGRVMLNRGSVHFLYAEPQHQDLLASYNALLITEENSNPGPIGPSLIAYLALPGSIRTCQIPKMCSTIAFMTTFVICFRRTLTSKKWDCQVAWIYGSIKILKRSQIWLEELERIGTTNKPMICIIRLYVSWPILMERALPTRTAILDILVN